MFLVHTDEGLTGISQVETQPHVAAAIVGAPGEASGMFSGLRALAIGQDPLQVEPLWDRLFVGSFYFGRRGAALQAISGIDIACWDILGKATGLPVAVLLGGRRRDTERHSFAACRSWEGNRCRGSCNCAHLGRDPPEDIGGGPFVIRTQGAVPADFVSLSKDI